jgi:hypothetical protein
MGFFIRRNLATGKYRRRIFDPGGSFKGMFFKKGFKGFFSGNFTSNKLPTQ